MLASTEPAPSTPPLPMGVSGVARFAGADPSGARYYYRARYYDPKVGRFISEDPAGFPGAGKVYDYVGGNPVSWRDPTGLWRVEPNRRAKPDENTIVCRSNEVVIHVPGEPMEDACGITGCIEEHERRHVEQVLADNPRICQGMPNGARVWYSSFEEENEMERDATCSVSVPCFEGLRVTCPEGCEGLVKDWLGVMKDVCEDLGGNPSR